VLDLDLYAPDISAMLGIVHRRRLADRVDRLASW